MDSGMKNHELIKDRLATAKGIAWDTCHKVYILMDDEQMELMREYEYDPLLSSDDLTPKKMYSLVRKWYTESCGLRFVEAVTTNTEDSNEGFEVLVGQGERFYN